MRPWALALAALLAATPALALTGAIRDERGGGLPFVTVLLMDQQFTNVLGSALTDAQGAFSLTSPAEAAFLVVQPAGKDLPTGVHVYPNQPRIFAVAPDTAAVNLQLPDAFTLVLEAYDPAGKRLRWEDFQRLGVHGGQFMYGTDLQDQMIPATCWPVHGTLNETTPADPREKGLPGLLVAPGTPVSLSVLFWPTTGYGKLLLRADNAGKGYQSPRAGDAQVLLLNLELARTAVAGLVRRQEMLAEGHAEIAAVQAALADAEKQKDRAACAKAADQVLSDALALRDRLELAHARASIAAAREGTLTIALNGIGKEDVEKTTVRIEPVSYDFLFGVYEGTDAGPKVIAQVQPLGFNYATVLPAWGWSENPKLQKQTLDLRFGISQFRKLGMTVKAHGVVWLQSYGILPEKAYAMDPDALQTALLAHEAAMLEAFPEDFGIWEVMNEPATTNVLNLPETTMREILTKSAEQIRGVNRPGLVNSPHEFSYGAKYLIYTTANQPRDDYPQTYSAFLTSLAEKGQLDAVDIIGLQCYPGFHLNEDQFGGQQGPAYTPSHLLDTLDHYVRFGKPLHITEFTLPNTYGAEWHSGYWKAPWTPELQADYAEAVYTLAYAHPQVHSITWWDVAAANPAVIGGSLLDAKGKPKPVLDRLAGLLKTWMPTEPREGTGPDSLTQSLPGGVYKVTVTTPSGLARSESVHVLERWTCPLAFDFGTNTNGQG